MPGIKARLFATSVTLIGTWFVPAQVAAQEAGASNFSEEIVVTARRREESLQEVPIAVTAVSAEALQRRQIDNIGQVGESIPNMTFQTGAPTGTGASTPSIFIRGIGSAETSLGTEPGVGLYVDDVYIARSVGSVLDLVDVESVQVLRGPQGTLFGRNSVGGAILIRTKMPADEFGATIEGRTGSFNRIDVRGTVDVPLSDTFGVKVSAMRAKRDGYVESDDSEAMGSTNRTVARATARWEPTSNLSFTVTGDYSHMDETAFPAVLLGLVPNIPGTPFPSSIQAISNLQAACGGASVLGNSGNPACIDQQFIMGPFRTAGGYVTNNPIFDSQGSRPFGNQSLIDVWGVSGIAEWEFSEGLTLKSITAYRELDAFWNSNSDHSANPGIETKNDQDQQQFTQELQLLGSSESFDWVVGGFYMHEKGTALNVVAFPEVIFRSGGGFATRSGALFAQGTYSITPALDLTAGLRYTHERKSFDTLDNQEVIGVLVDPVTRYFLDFRANPIPFVTGSTPDLTSDELTPHVNLAYRWNDNVMTYLSYSKGYKSGGYEQRLAPGTPEVPYFSPEYVDSFEGGVKTSAPESGLTVSAAVFLTKYRDMQISVVDGPAPTLTNAGDATLKGGELEASWRASDIFNLSGYVSILDAKYDSLTQRALNSGITLDSELPNVSKWQVGAAADWVFPWGSLELKPHVDWSYRSSLYVDSANTPLLYQPGVHLINMVVTLAAEDDRWSLSLSGRNLLDETYLVSGMAQYNIGQTEGQYARPREWALSAKFRF